MAPAFFESLLKSQLVLFYPGFTLDVEAECSACEFGMSPFDIEACFKSPASFSQAARPASFICEELFRLRPSLLRLSGVFRQEDGNPTRTWLLCAKSFAFGRFSVTGEE